MTKKGKGGTTTSGEADHGDYKDIIKKLPGKGKPYRKANIPKAIREQCWVVTNGTNFECKCYVKWCQNMITPFDFHVGHDVPESEGGTLDINNIKPICARCNLSMSDNYTIKQWNELSKPKDKKCFSNCF
jgi:5-methylcytosine-specific restriction endonuclease McrA|tara:strand:+ start:1225 stop:1614 length:390 start_codon:yes stop_codon:yes gene_type:complete